VGFDRLRPRGAAGGRRIPAAPRTDREGRAVLFTGARTPGGHLPGAQILGALGTVTVRCSACRVTTPLTPLAALRAAVPSLHLLLPRREHPSWMRCPACARRTWVRLGVRGR
jgi:hypothetical protein